MAYIERTELRNELYSRMDFYFEKGLPYLSKECSELIKYIDELPTADFVETKHGKWDYIATHDCFSCNICKFDSDVVMKYCGGCGAKMDLSEKPTGCERSDK